MSVQFADLPYASDALEPHVSEDTLEFHHGKHHSGYVAKLNAAIADTDYDQLSLEAIVAAAHSNGDTGVFNNAAQSWNHAFLWQSMTPDGGGEPTGELAAAIDTGFGDIDGFRSAFTKAALAQFGSGWTWLVKTAEGLEIVSTGNADTPLVGPDVPLLTLDVWEHAYYLDYQNQRGAYIDAFLNELLNWEFAMHNFDKDQDS